MQGSLVNRLGDVLVVGGGRMGTAIAQGILSVPGMSKDSVTIANPSQGKRERIERELGVRTVESARDGMPARCVILAVKPNVIPQAVDALRAGGIDASSLVISIAAGVSTAKIEGMLGIEAPVVRVMPNTPLTCGYGMSAISGGAYATSEDLELVRSLFAQMGKAVVVDESQQDVVCAVSGSGPAYFELFAQRIALTAQELGMPYDVALELAMQTMLGTAQLIDQTGQSLEDAIDSVCSPGGTTLAALDAMRAAGLEDAIASGVEAAAARSKELGA